MTPRIFPTDEEGGIRVPGRGARPDASVPGVTSRGVGAERSTGVLPPFQVFYDEHRVAVYRFLVATVGRQDAGDVFQETFLAALRAFPSLRDTSNLRGWVMTIAHRKAIDEFRTGARRPVPSEALPETPVADPEPDRSVWAGVAALPPKQRAAVAHRFGADLDYAQIGAVMGTSPEAARRNVHEGIVKLRATWQS